MNFPTLEQLEQRNLARIRSQFPDVEKDGKGILEVLAKMHAQAMHLAYGMIDWQTKQLFAHTATGDSLDRLLDWRPLPRLTAKKASGTASVSGQIGSVIPKGTTTTAEGGWRYQNTNEVKLNSANQVIKVQAIAPGTKGNCENQKGKWETAIGGLSQQVLLSATGGTDTETDEDYRSRALQTIQKRGTLYGKRGDYAIWAVAASEQIAQAWEVPNFENKAVLGVLVSGHNLAAVSAGALQNARTALEQRKLIGVLIEVLPAEVRHLDFRLAIVPDTPDLRLATENALRTYIKDRQQPVAQIVLSKLKKHLEDIQTLTSVAILSPSSDIRTSERTIPNLRTITWN